MSKERHTYTYGPVVELAQENSECVYCGRKFSEENEWGLLPITSEGVRILNTHVPLVWKKGNAGNISGEI